MQTHKVKFQVSLSDGQTLYEGKGILEEIAGEKSPWQKLQTYVVDQKVEITSLSLFTDDGRHFNLPTAGANPKFNPQIPGERPKPLDFEIFRYIDYDIKAIPIGEVVEKKVANWFTVAEVMYPKYKIQIWVDENNSQNSWLMVIENQ